MSWQQTAAPESATVALAAPGRRADAWHSALMGDARFRVVSQSVEAADLAAKMQMRPEVILLDGGIFKGPEELIALLTKATGAAYVVLPPNVPPADVDKLKACRAVKGVFTGDPNLAELAGRMYGDAVALRAATPSWEAPTLRSPYGSTGSTGMKVIAVWNMAGGVGKTTIAANLAVESARRGLPTLLVGLGSPDDLPLSLGLKDSPNITTWRTSPTADGLKAATQTTKGIDLKVIGGFPNFLSAGEAARTPIASPDNIARLAPMAAYAGYAVIILDVPVSELAAAAISSANTMLLVARPMLADAWRSIFAFRAATEEFVGEHRIPPDGVRLVVNRARASGLRPDDFHKACSDEGRRAFPPIVAVIPDDPKVEEAQNAQRVPLLYADSLARAVQTLADNVLQVKAGEKQDAPGGRVIGLGPIRVRVPGG